MDDKGQIIRRFKQFMDVKGLNNNQVTVKAGLSTGQIGKAIDRNKGLNEATVEKLLRAFPELNPVWLLTGEGDIFGVKDGLRLALLTDLRPDQDTPAVNEVSVPYDKDDHIIELEREVERLKAANQALLEAFKAIGAGKGHGASDVGHKSQKSA